SSDSASAARVPVTTTSSRSCAPDCSCDHDDALNSTPGMTSRARLKAWVRDMDDHLVITGRGHPRRTKTKVQETFVLFFLPANHDVIFRLGHGGIEHVQARFHQGWRCHGAARKRARLCRSG